jgi:branched-chain amino acid transport system substrate-binding protein
MLGFKTKFLISMLLMLTVIWGVSCNDSDDDRVITPVPSTWKVTALLATTGNSASFGESCWAAIELAEDDINAWLTEENSDFSIEFRLLNSEGYQDSALAMLEDISNDGVDIVIGPTTSSEATFIKDYATENDLLLISPSSVAISAAIPDDNLYRFVTDDTYQAQAMNALLISDGINLIIPFSRDDVWGNDLLTATSNEFETSGGVIIEGIKYDTETTDFTSLLDSLAGIVESIAIIDTGYTIGIYAPTFGEITTIFEQASEIETLLNVYWYGSSAAAKNANLVLNDTASEMADTVGFPCSTYGDNDSDEFNALKIRLEAVLGREAESYAFAAYDAAWVAAKSYYAAATEVPTFTLLKTKFIETCESYVGTTGPVVLNEAGDRRFGNYDFWAIRSSGDAFEWYKSARYEIDPDSYLGTLIRY